LRCLTAPPVLWGRWPFGPTGNPLSDNFFDKKGLRYFHDFREGCRSFPPSSGGRRARGRPHKTVGTAMAAIDNDGRHTYFGPMPKFLFIVLLAAAPFIPTEFCRSQQIYLPTQDPINEKIIELQAQGFLANLSRTERPWLIEDIVESILSDELAFDPSSKTTAEDILEYFDPMRKKDSEIVVLGGEAGLGIRALSRERREGYFNIRDNLVNRNFKNELGSVYSGRFWASRESRWGIDTRLIFDSDGTRYPWYYGTAHNDRIIGQFDHAYVNFVFDRFDFLFGRQRLVWGPSPRGSLILDDKSPPLDMFHYGLRLKPVKFSGFFARLDDYLDTLGIWNRRFFTGHRVTITPGKGWEIALSETYIYGGPNRLPELYYGIPLVLFYWEAQNRKLDDNAFWGLDISWVKSRLGHFYTQWVFDDIQREHKGPQKFAVQFGSQLMPSGLPGWSALFEINFIDYYVYGQRKRINAYLNWGWPIGRLDSDQREYFAGIYKKLANELKLGLEITGRDKGQYYAADLQLAPAPFDIEFPSGIVEHTREVAARFSCRTPRRSNLELRGGVQSIDNYRHIEGNSFDQFFATFQASYEFSIGLPFWRKYR